MKLNINNTFTSELPADPVANNSRRKVTEACFSYIEPIRTSNPKLIHCSKSVADLLGISSEEINSQIFLNIVTGNELIKDSKPYAMCYGGHQFGSWAGQLGDGRAINLAEVEHNGKQWTIQLKGAGVTPYSRGADGLAVLRSSIREYLCSEAMFYLGVPTTRALSLSLTGDKVMRDMLYDGNPAFEKGAIVSRVASSFLRFGSYEIFASRNDVKTLKTLVDYTINHFYPELEKGTKKGYSDFFELVANKTLDMIIHWERVGFVHGVMNTDNMSILGLTIDYGPYGWLEDYNPNWTPNTTDSAHKRYSFGKQAEIALWNLYKLANALYPLIDDADPFEKALNKYKEKYTIKHLQMMRNKLGLQLDLDSDFSLVKELEICLQLTETDMTIFFRNLAYVSKEQQIDFETDLVFLNPIIDAFYKIEDLKGETLDLWRIWMKQYYNRLQKEEINDNLRKIQMDNINPKYVFRNYMAQIAIEAAEKEDYSIIEELFELFKNPYSEQIESEKWFVKRPDWARTKIGCSMLSCSS